MSKEFEPEVVTVRADSDAGVDEQPKTAPQGRPHHEGLSHGDKVELRDDPEGDVYGRGRKGDHAQGELAFLPADRADVHDQIDVDNVSSVKVLQVGQPRNILKELHMTSNQYNWVASIDGIAYIIFEAPSNLLLKRPTPHVWQARIFLTWEHNNGLSRRRPESPPAVGCAVSSGAGMFPGVMAQLSNWYRTDEIGKPVTWFFSISALSSIVGSLLCYGISYMNGLRGLSAWRWVYIIEGSATILFSAAVFFLLPDYPKSPRSRRWLSEREQEFIEARLPENAPLTSDPVFSSREIKATLRSPLIWSFTLSQTLVNLGGYALAWYLPTIITNLGFAKLPKNQLMNIRVFRERQFYHGVLRSKDGAAQTSSVVESV